MPWLTRNKRLTIEHVNWYIERGFLTVEAAQRLSQDQLRNLACSGVEICIELYRLTVEEALELNLTENQRLNLNSRFVPECIKQGFLNLDVSVGYRVNSHQATQ